ncbi:hypothetical protein B0H16DRAFT_1748473 [Mycena metata]|uniref:Uncharacterized protein n=1 Tax=Mycena metata TaxID=1033252 RepID=A0AAD7DWU6_9AGAR|nr:hypothetical protein B0H16DRAFT_1748473 [Mycena metata]
MSSIAQSRAVSPIDFPTTSTDELTTTGELTTSTTLTHAEKQAQEQRAEDLLLLNNYFERIGHRQRIHEYAVRQHLKLRTKNSLRLVIETFDCLHDSEIQVPPLLYADNETFDPKAAIARGHALAFSPGTAEANCAWAYGYTYTDGEAAERYEAAETAWADAVTKEVLSPTEGRRHDVLEDHYKAPFSVEEAKLALERVQNLARRLLPKHGCEFTDVSHVPNLSNNPA